MYQVEAHDAPGLPVYFGYLTCTNTATISAKPLADAEGEPTDTGKTFSQVDVNCAGPGGADWVQPYISIEYIKVSREEGNVNPAFDHGSDICIDPCAHAHSPSYGGVDSVLVVPCGGATVTTQENPEWQGWETQDSCIGDWYADARTYITPLLGAQVQPGYHIWIADYEPKDHCVMEQSPLNGDYNENHQSVKCYLSAEDELTAGE